MARPVIALLRRRRPELQVAYTFFSPSAESFAQAAGADVADYLPFDTTGAARTLLNALSPSAIVFSKLDVWPLLAAEASARGVPLALTSAALSEASGRRSWLARLLLHDAYASLATVGAVHADDAARLVELGVRSAHVSVTGDVRYDQVWERVRSPRASADLLARLGSTRLASARPTLVAGSTWPSDETRLFDAWPELRRRVPAVRLVVTPHEPTDAHVEAIAAKARAAGAARAGVARIGAADPTTDIVIVDRVGVLADLYPMGGVAFVGGGFHDAGLHSVVEPAAHGVPVLFGPRHRASRDAAALQQAGGGFTVANPADLASRVAFLLGDEAARRLAGERARGVIAAGLGAAEKSAALVEALLRR